MIVPATARTISPLGSRVSAVARGISLGLRVTACTNSACASSSLNRQTLTVPSAAPVAKVPLPGRMEIVFTAPVWPVKHWLSSKNGKAETSLFFFCFQTRAELSLAPLMMNLFPLRSRIFTALTTSVCPARRAETPLALLSSGFQRAMLMPAPKARRPGAQSAADGWRLPPAATYSNSGFPSIVMI